MPQASTTARPGTTSRPEVRQPRLWNVVLLDDQDHTYEYVIEMVQRLFGYPATRAFEIAKTVDTHGRAVCLTTHRELGELKVEQIRAYGADFRIASCKGSMTAVIEPAECGDDDPGPRA